MDKINFGYVFLLFVLCASGLIIPLLVIGCFYVLAMVVTDVLGSGHHLPGDGDGPWD